MIFFNNDTSMGQRKILSPRRESNPYQPVSGKPWVRFPSGTQNFSLSHARVIVEKDHLHYLNISYFDCQKLEKSVNVYMPKTRFRKAPPFPKIAAGHLKVAQDPCYHYLCIYLKSMHELRRLKPTTIEIFMRKYFLKLFV